MPDPVLPDVTVIQLLFEAAVQLHPLLAVTFTVPVPAKEVNESAKGEIEKTQDTPLIITVWVCPATVIVPVSCVVPELGATE